MTSILPQTISDVATAIQSKQLVENDDRLMLAIEDTSNIEHIYQLGISCAENDYLIEAVIIFNALWSRVKNDPTIPFNLGILHRLLGNNENALIAYDLALSIKVDYVDALLNKANVLHELRRYDEAIINYDRALGIHSEYAELCWFNKGNTLQALGCYELAIHHYDKATELRPDYADAWVNKGNCLIELKQFESAILLYEQALQLDPNLDWIYGNLLLLKMKICFWDDYQKDMAVLISKAASQQAISMPFPLLSLIDNVELHKQVASVYANTLYPSNPFLGPIAKRIKSSKIRLGYFSADFKNHAVSILAVELFELHNRDQFEVVAFSIGVGDSSEMRLRLMDAFDQFIDASKMSDRQVAELAREMSIDIAINLGGFTANHRTGIFSYRAAPIQVNWLGYPGTLGADYIDYIIADNTLIPKESQQFYSEKVVTLPDTYMVDDSKRVSSGRKFSKIEFGLPEDSFIFCCFNNDYKFNQQVLNSWSRIMLRVEDSVLWISENNQLFKKNISAEFEKRGINSSRIIFAQRLESMADHLARYGLANLFIDTFPYNAHTTAVDALKAGVPVLTLIGQSFPGRVAASLLNAIGLPELITNTQEEYEALAIDLAMSPKRLAEINLKLANNRLTTPLFNTQLFAKNLEAAYINMYGRYHADLKPDNISIN